MNKIVIVSDTHTMHDQVQIPDGDILIHCGDWTNQGESVQIKKFFDWFSSQPHAKKVCIAGNHELSLDGINKGLMMKIINNYTNDNLHYLENSSADINGFKVYGSPISPFFFNWAFNRQRGKDIEAEWKKIPDDVNILITHGPPYGILDLVQNNISNIGRDLHQGCKDLSNRIKNLKDLKLNCFGHLHTDGGKQITINNVIYVNAACCTEQYQPINKPVVVEL